MIYILGGLFFGDYQGLALFILRLALGIIFVAHGWPKISNLTKTKEMFSQMMVPLPAFSASYAALAEFFGGLLLIVGFYTGWASLALAINMLGAMLSVKWKQPFKGGWELDLALFIMAVTILLAGPGSYSLTGYWTLY